MFKLVPSEKWLRNAARLEDGHDIYAVSPEHKSHKDRVEKRMSWIMVDVEADGPIPGDYSMVSVGAIIVREPLEDAPTFYGRFKPISEKYQEEALAVCNHTREETLTFPEPKEELLKFEGWLKEHGGNRPLFISDNNGFDFMFVCWYFWHFLGRNPFGHSSANLGSIYKGMVRNTFKNFKHLRQTEHTHNPVDDAKGNAEALLHLVKEEDLKISLK
jgi:hypothetical protein